MVDVGRAMDESRISRSEWRLMARHKAWKVQAWALTTARKLPCHTAGHCPPANQSWFLGFARLSSQAHG